MENRLFPEKNGRRTTKRDRQGVTPGRGAVPRGPVRGRQTNKDIPAGRCFLVKKTVSCLHFPERGGIVKAMLSNGVMVERLRQRFAKPVLVGSTPTHASNFAPSLRRQGFPLIDPAASFFVFPNVQTDSRFRGKTANKS